MSAPKTKPPTIQQKLIAAIDRHGVIKGMGITLLMPEGQTFVIREPAISRMVYYIRVGPQGPTPSPPRAPIVPRPQLHAARTAHRRAPIAMPRPVQTSSPSFWKRWGSAVMACSGATIAGAGIYATGGTATLFIGTLAANSALLCGVSLGKGYAYPLWQEFEKFGGHAFNTWMAAETAASLVDLFGGFKGAAGAVAVWRKSRKFTQIQAVLKKPLSRHQLIKELRKIDGAINPKLASKSVYLFNKTLSVMIAGKATALAPQVIKGAFLDSLALGLGLGGVPELSKTIKVFIGK